MSAPAAVAGRAVLGARRVSGGMVNDAWDVRLEDGGRAFVKARAGVAPGEYAAEADGLRWLGEPGAVRVRRCASCATTCWRSEWIDEGSMDARGAEAFGRGLAALHRAGAEAFGWHAPIRFGRLEISNEPLEDGWPAFYAERRLLPLARQAYDEGSLARSGRDAVEAVCSRIEELAGPPEPPARLHGDLWGGNVLTDTDGQAVLIDPAAHGGHREVDLAMLRLFGSPGPRAFDAYAEAAPLADGHEQRVGLWQLFPLLVHAVLFGGSYGASAERAARASLP